jgi:hypothetical protein
MKLQLTPQALRLRLDDAELAAFDQTGQLSHTLALGPGQHLTYALSRLPDGDPAPGFRVRYADDTLRVELPAALAQQLVAGEVVSLRGETAETDAPALRIVVEKDLGPSH